MAAAAAGGRWAGPTVELVGVDSMVEEPLLGLVEGVGACIALVLLRPLAAPARGLDVDERERGGPSYLRSVAVGFAAVGALDLVHACTTTPAASAWTRTASTLVGGLVFAAMALAPPRTQPRRDRLPEWTVLACTALGLAVAEASSSLPSLERGAPFAAVRFVPGLAGAIGYLVAARLFAARALAHPLEDARRADAQAIAIACIAFGVASSALLVVARWSAGWWLFHAVHLVGYLVVTRRLMARAQRVCEALGSAQRDLEHARSVRDELAVEKRAREEFVAGLAHDLRNPVHAAGLAAELLATGEVDPSQRDHCAARISASLRRVQRMIEDFLDANRISAGHALPLQLGRCDLAALSREVIGELAASEGDRFVLVAPAELVGWWWAKGLRRMLENLVGNAVKYGDPQRPVTVRIEASSDRVELSVHNWGRVLSPAELDAIFTPFARTRAADASGERGWGIGLTLVRGTAEAHGGRVSVRSCAAEGTVFIVELPRDARDRCDEGPAAAPATHARF